MNEAAHIFELMHLLDGATFAIAVALLIRQTEMLTRLKEHDRRLNNLENTK